ncbi:heterokaryon incompatibility protein-domain-containing protein [Plectosphaerella plurivora]|uniref:Heterokaryon incompatibility protein-domain-containing protein n=1 Tax=Plectosphaerella plurivora TaxID=936078 RepID=A0A9P8VN21_9PEZI|nr:heterokaryon incompatibility protein-domain-containing protein [Plectosphaerella plurivora]
MLLRLKEADGGEAASYTALSHRWGGDRTLKTTKTTAHKHLQGFTMEELPRTFQDAVLITQALGIKYVWIDSLCTIQDDVNDWLQQAAEMGSIYSCATFTIAAHSASQCNEGFLWRCQVPSAMRFAPLTGGPAFTVQLPEINYLFATRFDRSEISDRAWVLQELTLSPRILHFYENHLFWECEHGYRFPKQFENGSNSDSPVSRNATSAALFRDARNSLGLHDAWLQLVNRYSACKLTNHRDRLVAISGIANALQQGFSDDGRQAENDFHCGIIEAASGTSDPAFQMYFASQRVGWCWPDVTRLWPKPNETIVEHLTFLVVQSHDCEGSYVVPGAWCLIITPVQGGGDVYERVGIAFIWEPHVEKSLEQLETLSLV